MLILTFLHSRSYYETHEPCYPKLSTFIYTLWKFTGSILSLVVSFFGKSLKWAKICQLLVNVPLDIMWAYFRSCASPRVGAWLLIYSTTSTFHLSSIHFLITLHTCLSLPHSIVAHLSQCKCGHTIDNLSTYLL